MLAIKLSSKGLLDLDQPIGEIMTTSLRDRLPTPQDFDQVLLAIALYRHKPSEQSTPIAQDTKLHFGFDQDFIKFAATYNLGTAVHGSTQWF